MKEQSSGTSTTLQRSARDSGVAEDAAVHRRRGGGGDDEELPVEVGGAIAAADERERRGLLDLRQDLRRDDGDVGARGQEPLDLLERDATAADDEHGAARQVDAGHVVDGGRSSASHAL